MVLPIALEVPCCIACSCAAVRTYWVPIELMCGRTLRRLDGTAMPGCRRHGRGYNALPDSLQGRHRDRCNCTGHASSRARLMLLVAYGLQLCAAVLELQLLIVLVLLILVPPSLFSFMMPGRYVRKHAHCGQPALPCGAQHPLAVPHRTGVLVYHLTRSRGARE